MGFNVAHPALETTSVPPFWDMSKEGGHAEPQETSLLCPYMAFSPCTEERIF